MTWKQVRLKDVGTWYGGGTPSKSNSSFWADGDVPWLSPKDMGPEVLVDTQDHVTEAAIAGSSTKLVPEGSVAVVTRSGILERTIPIALVPFATTMNQDMKAVVPRDGIDARWIAWGLRAFERDLMRDTRKAGTTVASIEMPRWYDFELPVPSLDEQQRIISTLEGRLSSLDAADKYLADATKRADSLLIAHLGRARWGYETDEMRAIGLIADTQLGKMLDSKKQVGTLTRYLRNINVRWGSFDLENVQETLMTERDHERFDVRDGDVFACEGGEPGRCAVWRGSSGALSFQKALHRLRVHDRTTVMPEFLALMLTEAVQSGRCDHMFTGTTIKHLPQEKLRMIQIPVPSLDRQLALVSDAENLRSSALRMRNQVSLTQRSSTALRRSLLAAAFSGRLTEAGSHV